MRTPALIMVVGLALGLLLGAFGCGADDGSTDRLPVYDAGGGGIEVAHVPHHLGGTVYCVILDRGQGSYGRGGGISCDFVDYWQRGSSR